MYSRFDVRLPFFILVFLALVIVLGCNSAPMSTKPPYTPTPTSTPKPTYTPTPTPTFSEKDDQNSVRKSEIIDFILEDITVPVGTTIVWTNEDSNSHTTTSGVPPNVSGIWNSPFLEEGQKFSHTFTKVGEFRYWCRIHPFMTATVTVGK